MVARWGSLLLGLLLLMAVACEDDDPTGDDIDLGTGDIPPATAPADTFAPGTSGSPPREVTITIYDDRVDPVQIGFTAAPYQVLVRNQSGEDCEFFIGEYLTGLQVAPDESKQMGMTLPEGREGDTVEMGCANDEDRQRNAAIEFRGVLPGPGR